MPFLTEVERVEALKDAQYRAYAAMRRSDRNGDRPSGNPDRDDARAWAQVALALAEPPEPEVIEEPVDDFKKLLSDVFGSVRKTR